MSKPNQQDPMLLNTTTSRPNGLTRNRSKGHGHAVPIDIPTGERSTQDSYRTIFRRNDNLRTYKTSNMPGKRLPSHAAKVSSSTFPPRRAHTASSSSDEVITIEDERPKRSVVASMKGNQYARRTGDTQPQKKDDQPARPLRYRSIDRGQKRRMDFNIIKNDSDEEVATSSTKTATKQDKGKATATSNNSSSSDMDDYKDARDLFDIDTVEPINPPRKRRNHETLWEQTKKQQEQDEGLVLRNRWQNSNKDTPDDIWEQAASDHSRSPTKLEEKSASETELKIPTLLLRKRKKPIVFHDNVEDIPVRKEKSQKASTSKYQTGLRQRVTRSATSNLRKLLGQTQYITIDDDDDDETHSEGSSSPRADPSGQRVLFHYPANTPGCVTVLQEDANRLMDGEMLNDSIIDFYVKWLLETLDKPSTESVHIFNTFFYARLKQVTKGDPYDSVKKWTTKINLFEKKTIFVPINESSHWYLLVICNVGRCIPNNDNYIDLSDGDDDDRAIIYSLDSMGLARKGTSNRIIKYLQSAAKDRLGIEEKDFKKPRYQKANVPIQPNAYDCGIYVLHFIETFLNNPSGVLLVLTQKLLDDNIWQQKVIDGKRRFMTNLIATLSEEQTLQTDLKCIGLKASQIKCGIVT